MTNQVRPPFVQPPIVPPSSSERIFSSSQFAANLLQSPLPIEKFESELQMEQPLISGIQQQITSLQSQLKPRFSLGESLKGGLSSFGRLQAIGMMDVSASINQKVLNILHAPEPMVTEETAETKAIRTQILELKSILSRLISRQNIVAQRVPLGRIMEAVVFSRRFETFADFRIYATGLEAANLPYAEELFNANIAKRDLPPIKESIEIMQALNTYRHLGIYGLASHSPQGIAERLLGTTLELPVGVTNEALLQSISDAQLPSAESQALIDEFTDDLAALNKHWEETNLRILTFQAEFGTGDDVALQKMLDDKAISVLFSSNFAMGLMLPYKWFDENYWKSNAGVAVTALSTPIPTIAAD